MPECECGCNLPTLGGNFAPGHDQKLRVRLETKVGGILFLRDLVDGSQSYAKGEISLQDLGKLVKSLFQTEA